MLSRACVCAAALALVDAEGLEALTMRRLAARLDCEAMSLYKHVKDKADLLDAVHAAVLGGLQPETNIDHIRAGRDYERIPKWRLLLGGLARALRSALLAHPKVVPLFTSQHVTAPEAVQTVGNLKMTLVLSRFSESEADRAIHVVGMFTIGHAIFEQSTRNDDTFRFGLEALLDGIAREHRKSTRNA
jgi:TetR/AcrR family transcriptional regulator, tetracycline repressor protein